MHSSSFSLSIFNWARLLYAIAFAFEDGWPSKTSIASLAKASARFQFPLHHQSRDRKRIELPVFSTSFFFFQISNALFV